MSGLPLKDPHPAHSRGGLSRVALVLAGLVLTALCGLVDWFSGPEIAFSVIYLIPISLVAWRGGRWFGLAYSLICGQTWLLVELMTNTSYSHAIIPYWNGLVRFMVFCTVALLVSEVAERKRGEKALREARDQSEERARKLAESEATLARQRTILQSVLNSMGEGVLVVDSMGNILLSNPAADAILKLTGYAPNADNHPLTKVLRERMSESREISVPQLDSSGELWLLVNDRPLHSADEKISGGVIVFNDITSLRQLERQIGEVSDREQRRLGQDLHDGLCQQLVGMAFAAQMLASQLREDNRPEAQEADRMTESLNDAITQARDIARGLYPVQLEMGGLASALEELATRVRSRHRLNCSFVDRATAPITETSITTNLFRIAQEAVGNALKHAKAKHVSITLDANESQLILRITDDGVGLKNVSNHPGMGLHIMQHRAQMIGGTCTIAAASEGGTVVTCTLLRRGAATNSNHGN